MDIARPEFFAPISNTALMILNDPAWIVPRQNAARASSSAARDGGFPGGRYCHRSFTDTLR